MSSPILIFGCNSLSLEVARQLTLQGREFALVSSDKVALLQAKARSYRTLEIDYTDDKALIKAGLGADVEVAFVLFQEDSRNVFLTISMRPLASSLRIVALAHSDDSRNKLVAAGADKVIDPYEISGRKIYDLMKRPLIAETMDSLVFGEESLNLEEVRVCAGSPLDGRRLGELELSSNYNLVLLGVVDRELGDQFIFSTSGVDHRLDPGDVLVVIGPVEELDRFRRDNAAATPPA